jgi:hypothetical protein
MRNVSRHLYAAILATAIGSLAMPSCHAAHAQARPAGAAGSWKMTINFSDEARAAGLEIVIKDRAVSGKFVAAFAGGEVPIEGEIADGTLSFQASTTGGPHPGMSLDFTATLKDNATLAGTMSAPFGDFAWTAERIR